MADSRSSTVRAVELPIRQTTKAFDWNCETSTCGLQFEQLLDLDTSLEATEHAVDGYWISGLHRNPLTKNLNNNLQNPFGSLK